MTTRENIDDFLKQRRLALVGVSHNAADFTRILFQEFVRRGYDTVPVNPNAAEIEGQRCFARVQDITPPVDGVLVLTPSKLAERVVMDCASAGVKRVWLYRAVGQGAVSKVSVQYCKANGIHVIPGYCPFMFWPDTAFFHRLHRGLLTVFGRMPD
jgi:predicted CoA-binding protein